MKAPREISSTNPARPSPHPFLKSFILLATALPLACQSPVHEEPRKPNLVVVYLHETPGAKKSVEEGSTSEWRARLDREGAILTQVMSPSDDPIASIASMMTAEYPIVHGLPELGPKFPPRLHTLAAILTREGYATGAWIGDPKVGANSGLERGFQSFEFVTAKSPETKFKLLFDGANTWIEEHADEQFFLFLEVSSTPPAARVPKLHSPREPNEIDRGMDRLIETLEKRGLFDETLLVVITRSERDSPIRAKRLGPNSVHLRLPSRVAGASRLPSLVSLIDLPPTILQTLDISERSGTSGRALIDAIQGDPLAGRGVRFAQGRVAGTRWIAIQTEDGVWVWQDSDRRLVYFANPDENKGKEPSPADLERARALLEAYVSLQRHRRPNSRFDIRLEHSFPRTEGEQAADDRAS